MNVGFIGLGRMGKPMSSNLCRKGFQLVVHDINLEAVHDLEQLKARAATPNELAAASDIIITMLPNSQIVKDVLLGLLPHVRRGSLIMDMSTIDPLVTDFLAAEAAKKGVEFVDAPVGRLASHADRGECLFMVGASEANFERVKT